MKKLSWCKIASIVLLGIIALFSISSCKKNLSSPTHNKDLPVIRLSELEEKDIFYPDDNIERCFFLPLETTDSCLIGRVRQIVFADSLIFVHDSKMSKLFVFDMNGKFLNQIGMIGQGPDELISLTDFYINENEKFVGILDLMRQKMYRYAYDGKLTGKFDFTSEINFSIKIGRNYGGKLFIPTTNNLDNSCNYFIVNEKDYSLYKQALPYIVQGKGSTLSFANQMAISNRFYALALLSDTIYSFMDDDLSPAFIFDNSLKKITKEIIMKNAPYEFAHDSWKYLMAGGFSLGMSEIFSVKDYLYFDFRDYTNKWKQYSVFWNPVEQKGFYTSKNPFCPYHHWTLIQLGLGTTYQDAFVYCIEASEVEKILADKESFKNPDDVKVLENVREDDNPVLIFYHIKD
jgi:hypothetical protein